MTKHIIALVGSTYSQPLWDALTILETIGFKQLKVLTNEPNGAEYSEPDLPFRTMNSSLTMDGDLIHISTEEFKSKGYMALTSRNKYFFGIEESQITQDCNNYVVVCDPYLVLQMSDAKVYSVHPIFFEYYELELMDQMVQALKKKYGTDPLPTKLISEFLANLLEDRKRLESFPKKSCKGYTDLYIPHNLQYPLVNPEFVKFISDYAKPLLSSR